MAAIPEFLVTASIRLDRFRAAVRGSAGSADYLPMHRFLFPPVSEARLSQDEPPPYRIVAEFLSELPNVDPKVL